MKSHLSVIILIVVFLAATACTPQTAQNRLPTTTSLSGEDLAGTGNVQETHTPTAFLDSTGEASSTNPSITSTAPLPAEESGMSSGHQFQLIEEDIWTESEITPSDVIDQISLAKPGSAGGGGPCLNPPENAAGEPIIYYLFPSRTNTLPVNASGYICFHNFQNEESITFQLLDPAEDVIRSEELEIDHFMEQGSAMTEVTLLPGARLGTYTVLAQGKNEAVRSAFDLVEPEAPILAVENEQKIITSITKEDFGNLGLEGAYVQPGSDILLHLAGFRPNQPLTIYVYKSSILYRPAPNSGAKYVERVEYSYVAKVNQELSTDSSGVLTARFPTGGNTPPGVYLLIINGDAPQQCAFQGFLLSTYGDIETMRCDLILLLRIGDSSLSTLDQRTETFPCPNTLPSQLAVGMRAMVSTDPPLSNTVRADPSLQGKKTGVIAAGQEIELLEGPRCVSNYNWWRVRDLKTNLTGWTAEGDQKDYWLVPIP